MFVYIVFLLQIQTEVLKKYEIKIKSEDSFIGVLRLVTNNPQTMFDGSKVIR